MSFLNYLENNQIYLIAEAGNNHEGSLSKAIELIFAAKESGASAVKFQSIVPSRLVHPSQSDRLNQLKKFQLSIDDYQLLAQKCASLDLDFSTTCFDLDTLNELKSTLDFIKIASGDNNFYRLIVEAAKTQKPILISNGLATNAELKKSTDLILEIWNNKNSIPLVVMQCTSLYPAPPCTANLGNIRVLQRSHAHVGLSDHTLGHTASLLAVGAGAKVIEKHFTLDKQQSSFRDHSLSADPAEFKRLVELVRECEEYMGSQPYLRSSSEIDSAQQVRRGCYAARDILSGTAITGTDVVEMRPASSVDAWQAQELIGSIAHEAVNRHEPLKKQR